MNIKNIGKELMGKSLNSYHRRTGLIQLEENNKMQDGILNGMLSQVDDVYIEKTEQSNVIHLEGSGDGVVVLDNIEGNTMVNLFDDSNITTEIFTVQGCKFNLKTIISKYGKIYIPLEKLHLFKSNGKYKVIVNITKNTLTESEGTQSQRAFQMLTYNYAYNAIEHSTSGSYSATYNYGEIGIKEFIITMKDFDNPSNPITKTMEFSSSFYADSGELEGYIIISEYNESAIYPTQPFEGLQSSFEEKVNSDGKYEIEILSKNSDETKVNKIKVLVNEPLRKSDRLCIKDNKLMVERNVGQVVLNNLNCNATNTNTENVNVYYFDNVVKNKKFSGYGASSQSDLIADNKKTGLDFKVWDISEKEYSLANSGIGFWIFVPKNIIGKEWLASNPTTVIYPLAQSEYEEVTNEYGEPIILEGYEGGTLYIDSTIVPTTTVKYTPKMESLNTLKEVSNNNVMLTNDINETIIPYLMEVDLMLMEKEMALMSYRNIRKAKVTDMTSMQKRTQDMLERLIKGKTLTEQECKTRVTTYLNAGKITDTQAEELMLLISEVYA